MIQYSEMNIEVCNLNEVIQLLLEGSPNNTSLLLYL